MELRVARRGRNAGKEFWGCRDFPACRGIVDVETPAAVVESKARSNRATPPRVVGGLALSEGESVTLSGKVGVHTTRRRKTGQPFVKASLTLEDGTTSVQCVWWDAARAPRMGTKVRLEGEGRAYEGVIEVHVRRTEPVGTPGEALSPLHRLIRYYIDCIEAEGIQELILRQDRAGEGFLLFQEGSEPLITKEDGRSGSLPDKPAVRNWCSRRLMAGQAERVFIGYPVVRGVVQRDGKEIPSLAALFYSECRLERTRSGAFELVATTSLLEVNPFALDLLGMNREERHGVIEGLETLEELGEVATESERMHIRMDFLRSLGLLGASDEIAPDTLKSSRGAAAGVHNEAVLFVGERAATTRQVLADLEELLDKTEEDLRRGPLGVILGVRPTPKVPSAEPQPSILPTNLSQDRAITAGRLAEFAVVTGPPGTGKSQVLVNLVAASVIAGDTVLFASKNNQAVDVVFERLAAISNEAAPLRAGATRYRGDLARRINEALARPRAGDLPMSTTRAKWAETATKLQPAYEVESKRDAMLRTLAEEEKKYVEIAKKLPDYLLVSATSFGAEMRSLVQELRGAAQKATRRGLFRKRRLSRFEERLAAVRRQLPHIVLGKLAATISPASAIQLSDTLFLSVDAAAQLAKVDSIRRALDELPDAWDLHESLLSLEDERMAVSRALFETHWKDRVRNSSTDARAASGTYRDSLERLAQGTGGSATQARELIPKVLEAFPVWGVTNLSARTNFSLAPALFDLVIIDEASQCDIPSALPLLFRAKRALIIGDRNQLIHVSSLRQERDRALAERHALDGETQLAFGYRDTSLFALASRRVGEEPLFLDHHFRSHAAIITFSNDHFYGARLTVLTPERHLLSGPAVRWIHVKGSFKRGPRGGSVRNPEEARMVASEVANILPELKDLRLSMGIVTPYRAQVDAIRDEIAKSVSEAVGEITVDTAHRFQGDERDVMIFSPTISKQMPDFHVSFANNPNLVNVAITRARSRLLVVGDRDACLASPGVIGALATYIHDLDEGGFESPIERRLFEALSQAGLRPSVGVRLNSYRLDLAVETPHIRLDIECDGAAFHKDRRRDRIRDAELEKAGWRVLRFSGIEILRQVDHCVEVVTEALAAPERGE